MLDQARWYAVASSHDLPYRHVYQTRLGGRALAIWRDRAGAVNVWDDRCPHRGVRFSIGNVLGDELRCQYHAWRFASGSGACRLIPSQPMARPDAAVRATVWPVREQAGLVWTGLTPEGDPRLSAPGAPIRAMPINRSAAAVEAALPDLAGASLLVQPVEAERCVVRGVAAEAELEATDLALERLRRTLEAAPC
jgi:phenylpropionate dioxygenase-like ring-hydroxylating dioxygenase large terminal subunit